MLDAIAGHGAMNATKCLLKEIPTDWSPFAEPEILSFSQVLFLTCVYGWILFQASDLISNGAELLMLIPSIEKIVSSVVLPILGAVPDGMMVLFSGVGPQSVVMHEVKAGVGALAGSTIMLLTLPWFIAVVIGRVSIKNGSPNYRRPQDADDSWVKLKPGDFSLTETGVAIGSEVQENAKFMLKTMGGYLVIQLPALLFPGQPLPICSFIGLILSIVGFCYYNYKMWADSLNQHHHADKAVAKMRKAIRDGDMTIRNVMRTIQTDLKMDESDLEEPLLKTNAEKIPILRRLTKLLIPFYEHYDTNRDCELDFHEFTLLAKDMRLSYSLEQLGALFTIADDSKKEIMTFDAFCSFVIKESLEQSVTRGVSVRESSSLPRRRSVQSLFSISCNDWTAEGSQEEDDDDDSDSGDEEEDMPPDLADLPHDEQQRRIKLRALSLTSLGTFFVLVFSDPTIALMTEIGDRLGISPFYVAFILAPLASNASELVAAKDMASKRTAKHQENAMKVLEGAACMNNTFCLATLLLLVYVRSLPWDFVAETTSILLIEVVVAYLVSFKKVQTLGEAFLILALYPLSLLVVAFMEKVLGFD